MIDPGCDGLTIAFELGRLRIAMLRVRATLLLGLLPVAVIGVIDILQFHSLALLVAAMSLMLLVDVPIVFLVFSARPVARRRAMKSPGPGSVSAIGPVIHLKYPAGYSFREMSPAGRVRLTSDGPVVECYWPRTVRFHIPWSEICAVDGGISTRSPNGMVFRLRDGSSWIIRAKVGAVLLQQAKQLSSTTSAD
jgi:hypothetical protein